MGENTSYEQGLSDEELVETRLSSKLADYEEYRFTSRESVSLNILLDLLQEFNREELLWQLPVQFLYKFFGLRSEFYVWLQGTGFQLMTQAVEVDSGRRNEQGCPLPGEAEKKGWLPEVGLLGEGGYSDGKRVCLPVLGRFEPCAEPGTVKRELCGVLVLYPENKLSRKETLFYAKVANRLGFSLDSHKLSIRNQRHIDFVRNLVKDIGHNVLGPGMYFKLLLSQLQSGLVDLGEILKSYCGTEPPSELNGLYARLLEEIQDARLQFNHNSLFLESLLRESHFIQGCYVLRCTSIDFLEQVLRPQFTHFQPMLQAKGITTDIAYTGADGVRVEADLGLISQVLANLFSNAVKYTSTTASTPQAFMRCRLSCENIYDDKLGCSVPGLRLEVLTSGERIKSEEMPHLFEQHYRASNTANIAGTGRGLNFIREIVALHHGRSGYEATPEGNLFFFELPLQSWGKPGI